VNRCLNSRSNNAHLSHDAIDSYKLVDKVSFQASRSHMVSTEVSVEVDIVDLSLLGELNISCQCHFLGVSTLPVGGIVGHSLDGLIKLVLECFDCSKRVAKDKIS